MSIARDHLLAAIASVSVLAATADAVTRHVPAEYATIQAGVDAAVAGDTVLVAPGDYGAYVTRSVPGLGNVTAMAFLKDGVVLKGEGGSAVTRLVHSSAGGAAAPALMAYGLVSDATVVEGFLFMSEIPHRGGIWSHQSKKLGVRACVFQGLEYQGLNGFLSDFDVVDSRFEDCQGEAAAVLMAEGTLLLARCTFLRCSNSAVDLHGGFIGPVDRVEIQECLFQDCVRESPGGGGGGAIQVGDYVAGALVDRCLFVSNRTNNRGGAVQIGGFTNNPVISNCLFWNNEAAVFGGSLEVRCNGLTQVTGNTFFSTELLAPLEGGGSAVYFLGSGSVQFVENIIASTRGAPAVGSRSALITTGCNVFWDNPDGIGAVYTPGPTDRIVDPLFCDPIAGNFQLRTGSPCLPAGSIGCELIGAFGHGCGTVSVDPASWAKLKATFR